VHQSGDAAGILVTHSRVAANTTDRILMLTRDGLRAARDAIEVFTEMGRTPFPRFRLPVP
jgi:hypothetical protein